MENIKNKLISLGKQFLIIILYIFLTVLISLPFAKYLDKSNLCNILISLIILIIFLYIFRKTVIPNFYDFKKNGFKYLKASYTIYLIGLAIMIISNLIISLFMSQAQNETAVESILFALPIYSIKRTFF